MAAAPAYDIVAQALGGTMSITGAPGGEPTRCGVSIGDLAAALYGVIAILAALRERDLDRRRPPSGHRDARLPGRMARRCARALLSHRQGARADRIAPSVDHAVSAFSRRRRVFRRGLRQRIDLAALLRRHRDERPATRPALPDQRGSHRESRRCSIRSCSAISRPTPRAYWLERLEIANVPCAPIATVAEVARQSASRTAPDDPARRRIRKFDGLIVAGLPAQNRRREQCPRYSLARLGRAYR